MTQAEFDKVLAEIMRNRQNAAKEPKLTFELYIEMLQRAIAQKEAHNGQQCKNSKL